MYWIWVKAYQNGEYMGCSRSVKSYVRKGNAERVARDWYKDHGNIHYEVAISGSYPFKEEE